MIKKTLICDRCGKMVDTAYRIEFHSVDVEENEGNAAGLGKFTDYCMDCLEQIALCANNGVVVAAETQQEEEKPRRQYRAKTLYLMQLAGKSIDQIAEETGYSAETVCAKLKKFQEGQNADSEN